MTDTTHSTVSRCDGGFSAPGCECEFYRLSVLVTAVTRVQSGGKPMFLVKTIATSVRKPYRMPGTAQHHPPGATIF